MKIRNSILSGFIGLFVMACGGANDTPQGPGITAKISVVKLPETLPINMENSTDNSSEYLWHAAFDMDDNGSFSAGDLKLELVHYKRPGSLPTDGKPGEFEALVYEYIGETSFVQITKGTVQVNANTITLSVAKSSMHHCSKSHALKRSNFTP